ncbi:hypothetical protein ACHAW6_002487 [Cyclotella cf. meneghiniana]
MSKRMYSHVQAGLLAQELLEKRLNAKEFKQSTYTPMLWAKTRPVQYTLVVDNFGVKYVRKDCHLPDRCTQRKLHCHRGLG